MVKKRDAVLQVYVTPEEKTQIEAIAASLGLSAAAYLRSLALAEVAKASEPASEKPAKR
jgi:hypothetical protein